MPRKLYVRVGEPGYVRVSNRPDHSGVRMSVCDIILGLAKRGSYHHAV